jgi:hypothetical protein
MSPGVFPPRRQVIWSSWVPDEHGDAGDLQSPEHLGLRLAHLIRPRLHLDSDEAPRTTILREKVRPARSPDVRVMMCGEAFETSPFGLREHLREFIVSSRWRWRDLRSSLR